MNFIEIFLFLVVTGFFATVVFKGDTLKKLGVKIGSIFEASLETHQNQPHENRGGHGGNAKVNGFNSTAIGGKGGGGGPSGNGGDGGHAEVIGDNSFAMGGEGGEAGQKDRGGKGGRGPLHVLIEDYPERYKELQKFGITEEMAKTIGKGGDGTGPLRS